MMIRRLFSRSKGGTQPVDGVVAAEGRSSIGTGTPAISRFLRDLVGGLSDAPTPETSLVGMLAESSPLVPCHEWRAEKFHIFPELEERLTDVASEHLISAAVDIPTLLAFQFLVGQSTLREAAEQELQGH